MTCINCQTESDGTYCPACGQRMEVKRINFKEGWQDFWARIYGFDGMFPRTLRDLTIRPGAAARTFIEGNRVAYYGPVGYFFLMITLFLLVLSLLGLDLVDFLKGVQQAVPVENSKPKVQEAMRQFVVDNLKLLVFLIIPFMALSTRYIFFRRSGYNFLENSVLPFYAMGHQYWLSIFGAVYYKLSGALPHPAIHPMLTIIYIGFAYTSLFTNQSGWKVFFKGVFALIFAVASFVSFVVACWLIWFFLFRPA